MSVLAKFRGGPAEGQSLQFQRDPIYLRVVRLDAPGKDVRFDVLDLLNDSPADGETVSVYRLAERFGPVFVCRGPKGSSSGRMVTAEYRHLPDFPTEGIEDAAVWRQRVDEAALAEEGAAA